MKLRLEKDTVKIRLSPDEKNILKAEKSISEKFQLSKENGFSYSIHLIDDSDKCLVEFKNHSLEISVPYAMADKWMDSSQVGIKETISTDNGGEVALYVEEDLPPRKSRERK